MTIDIVEILKSQLLATELVKILAKLNKAEKSAFTRLIEDYGFEKLRTVVKISLSLGNLMAREWIKDSSFAEWFALNKYHNPVGWRS